MEDTSQEEAESNNTRVDIKLGVHRPIELNSVPISDGIIGYAVTLKSGWPARRATAPFLLSGRGIE